MLGTSEEAQMQGDKTYVTHGGATQQQQHEGEAAAPPSSGLSGGDGGGLGAGGYGAGGGRSKMSLAPFSDAPEGVRGVLSAVSGMFAARGMADTCGVVKFFARDCVVDTPLAFTHRKGEMRVGLYLGNLLFGSSTRFRPAFVEWGSSGPGSSAVEITGEMVLAPRRTLLVPPTLLLPRELRFRATVVCGVRGDLDGGSSAGAGAGLIEYVRFRAHNLPVPPAFLRSAIGGTVASALHATEPIWSQAAGLWGEDFYARRQQQRAHGAAGFGSGAGPFGGGAPGPHAVGYGSHAGGAGLSGAVADTTNAAIDFGSAVVNRAAEYVGYFASTARHAAESVLPSALVGGAGHPHGTTAAAGGTMPAGGGGGYAYGAGTTMGLGGGGGYGGASPTAASGLTGFARDVAAKGSDVAQKARGKAGEATGLGASRKTAGGMGGGGMGSGGTGTYAAATAAPEAGGARRRERGVTTGGAD